MAAEGTSPADRVKGILSSFLHDVNSEKVLDSSSVTDEIRTSSKEENVAERSPAKLRSREAFFARIETYWPSRWFAKISALSPLVCAMYGWESIDEDLLKCVSCGAFLSGELPNPSNDSFEECCSVLKRCLVTAHKKFCYWSTNPCPDSFLQVPHYDHGEVRKQIRLNYRCLCELKHSLPKLDYTSVNKWGSGEECFIQLAEKLKYSPDSEDGPTSAAAAAAAALAITGWMTGPSKDIIMCSHCRRQIGLWNFESEGESTQGVCADGRKGDSNENVEPQTKRRRLSSEKSVKTFDPIEEHRHWCPWITNARGAIPVPSREPHGETSCPEKKSDGKENEEGNPDMARPSRGQNGQGGSQESAPNTGDGAEEHLDATKSTQTPQKAGSSQTGTGEIEESARETEDTPGWLRTVKVVLSEGGSPSRLGALGKLVPTSMLDGLRSIRRLLRDWSSPLAKTN